jgi:CRP-like cAMP-binding protein
MLDVEDQFDELVASFPVTTYRAGETLLASGEKSGQLLILENGQIVALKESVEIEPPRVLRRPVSLSHAARACCSWLA